MSSSGSLRHEVNDIVALARDASMSSTYKPALLKALIRIVGQPTGLEVPLAQIAAQFVILYWSQTVVFRLRQAATLTKEPEVVRAIRSAAEIYRVRELEELPNEARIALEREMVRVLKINVLELFHRSKPDSMAPLFEWARGSESITLTAKAATFLKINANVLESVGNLWWARYLEKVNLLAPLVIEKVERNGARRSPLGKYLALLRQVDEPRCFYCARDLGLGAPIHVDHVIPWSFLLADPLWDLVLACPQCNLAKSDLLPRPDYLDRLVATSVHRGKVTLPPGFSSPLLAREEIDRYYNAALSVEWPSGWSPGASSVR
ncbi:MAG: HNH endonuclease [Candidatus Eremiobacteraeota bacterium]|nr:HNH endonuclease [Candidatus Eremiobacteraeota bacterium]